MVLITAIARRTISASPSRSTSTAKGPPVIATRMGRFVARLISMNRSHFRRSFPACPRKSTSSQKTLEKCRTTLFRVPMPMLRMAASLAFERAGMKLTCRRRITPLITPLTMPLTKDYASGRTTNNNPRTASTDDVLLNTWKVNSTIVDERATLLTYKKARVP